MALVRVKLDSGDEATVGEDFATSLGLTILNKPAVDTYGTALPAKPARPMADLATPSKEK